MLLDLNAIGFPADSSQLFGRDGSLMLEVGFGNGDFLIAQAARHPEVNYLGVEVSLGAMTRAFRKARRQALTNVRFWKGPAQVIVRNVIPPHGLQRVYVNFPDPWPRERHRKHRLLQADFFRLLSTRLAEGGDLQLTTDHHDYFVFAQEQAAASELFSSETAPPPPDTLLTKYAEKWQDQGRPIYHIRFTKTGEADPYPPTLEKTPMQHAVLDGSLDAIQSFSKYVHRFSEGVVVLSEAMRPVEGRRLLLMGHVEEHQLRQDLLIEARPHDEGGVLVTLRPFGNPVGTRGLREAIRAACAWLETQGLTLREGWF